MIRLVLDISEALIEPLEIAFYDIPEDSWAIEQTDISQPPRLCGYFETEGAAREAHGRLAELVDDLPKVFVLSELEDCTWQEEYKRFLHPWSSGPLHWVPQWQRETYDSPPEAVLLYVDAGMAFGTGDHATTRLAARRMLDYREAHGTGALIDAGCGSGILALSGQLLGFGPIDAFDHDALSIEVAEENARRNGITGVPFVERDLLREPLPMPAPLVLANIQADILLRGAEPLLKATLPGGWLVLTGILATERDKFTESFLAIAEKVWGKVVSSDCRGEAEWVDLCLIRPEAEV